MAWSGIGLLLLVAAGIIGTGLPAAVVLITAATVGAIAGVLTDTIPLSLLGAMPGRLLNLFENDLLQALPLYIAMGLLLDRLPVADALYRASNAMLPRSPSAPLVSGMLLGALLGPMNGSVGASVLALSRVLSPRLLAEGIAAPTRLTLISVASTFGVLVPPSLVLILLSDAMLSAHTMAVTQTGRSDRVINSQDIFHAALLPGGLFLLLCIAIAWLAGRNAPRTAPREPLSWRTGLLAFSTITALIVLLGGIATGYLFAVEGAATGAFLLLMGGLITGRLHGAVLRDVLSEALALTGALFTLLLAATTFTLILKLLGTAQLVSSLIAAIPGEGIVAVAAILGVIAICAFVFDAFEIIFVVVPIVIPPLLIREADAQWVAVLVLLTLQSSFLLPPFGYALLMARGIMKEQVTFPAFLRALAPFLAAQWLVLLLVLFVPRLVHIGENAADRSRSAPAAVSKEEIDRRMNEMMQIPLPDMDDGK